MLPRKELTTLLITVIMTKMVLTFPKILIETSGSAAWMQITYNVITAFLLYLIVSWIYKGQKSVIELARAAGGKFLKVITGIIVFTVFMMNFASIIRVFPETIKTVLLQGFDTNLITVIFMTVIAIGASLGIESIVRVNYLFMPFIGGVLVLFLVLLIPYYNVYNILPLFGNGVNNIFLNGFHTISVYSDLLLINILLPYYKDTKEFKKSGRRVFFITAPLIIAIILAYCLVYPYPVSGEFMIPFYQLARIIHLENFYSSFEAVFQFAWSILLFLYSAIYVYALSFVWQKTFDLDYYRPLVFPIVIISGVVALLPSTLADIIGNEKIENIIIYPVVFFLPFIFSFVSRKYYKKGADKLNETV